ncbi:uncharacterized protein K452DRAFT_334273 [Aplosporella prunicola CBS 121167]|uniref:Uncharacterized protein n=1 Tax=Aplosporella prunicola CBS 121167 TaxID=1176127 RepID=A0A6A6ATG5_9PEZI|nr:uncharacterized protein K452DRAFT_334273 [Aplosporella prunicola CBS 121167]KAF2135259.1 hypothetical protein K452DRAFT_334273 [Aplosporella prunicola CBS 121167]
MNANQQNTQVGMKSYSQDMQIGATTSPDSHGHGILAEGVHLEDNTQNTPPGPYGRSLKSQRSSKSLAKSALSFMAQTRSRLSNKLSTSTLPSPRLNNSVSAGELGYCYGSRSRPLSIQTGGLGAYAADAVQRRHSCSPVCLRGGGVGVSAPPQPLA